jgi:Protein of unknown function (DUF3592)
MRIRDEPRRPHSAAQWLIGALAAVIGIGMLIAAVAMPIKALNLRDNGIHTSALVQDIEHSGKTTNYELTFTLQDGTPFATWTNEVHSGTQVGGTIQIAYLPASPTTVEDVRDLGRWWAAPAIFAPGGMLFLWFGWAIWHGSPESFRRALRARYGR